LLAQATRRAFLALVYPQITQIDEAVRCGNGPAITLAALLTGLLALLGRRRFRQRERATGTRAEQVGRNLWKSA
jgi:uncharacterized protein (TIGR03382 family)